ncbi:MAG: hypothetical protein ABSG22_02190 [Sedimentisphaerales bacterium]|jgi:hypothetical protein
MAQGRKGKLNYRCPLCFRRDIDMDMLFDSEKNEYYCIRCSFTGSETQVQVLNAETKRRYADRRVRITDFGPRTETPAAGIPKRVPITIEANKTPAKSPARKTNVESR